MKPATLYTRAGCHLCDDAARVLVAHGLTLIEVDIDADQDLMVKYSTQVPVVEINGKVRFRGASTRFSYGESSWQSLPIVAISR